MLQQNYVFWASSDQEFCSSTQSKCLASHIDLAFSLGSGTLHALCVTKATIHTHACCYERYRYYIIHRSFLFFIDIYKQIAGR